MHAEPETETQSTDPTADNYVHPNPAIRALADIITPQIRVVPEAEVDNTPATLAEVSSMCGLMDTYGTTASTWQGLERQIPGFALATGRTIEQVWAMAARDALPGIVEHMRAGLRSDRFTKAATELTAISEAMRPQRA